MNASITITNPATGPSTGPSVPPKTPKTDPEELRKKREMERLKHQDQQIKRKMQLLQPDKKQPLTNIMKALASVMVQAQNPNEDPMVLYAQVRPLLVKMGLNNIVIPNKTELMLGKTQAKNSNYCVLLRRQAEIDSVIVDRIKRVEKNLDKIVWDTAGIKIYVWWPYKPPAEPGVPPPAAPAGPA